MGKSRGGMRMDAVRDLQLAQITAVYELTTLTWSRPRPAPKAINTLAYFREGAVAYCFEDETLIGRAGDILALPRGMVYSGRKLEEKNSYYVIEFETNEPWNLEAMGLERILSGRRGGRERFRRILECWNRGERLLCRSLIYELLHSLVSTSPEAQAVSAASALMKQRLSDPALSMTDLCAAASVSETQLRRLFHRETGLSPMQYLHDLRIAQARNLLLQGDISVGEVAEICGYSSLFYFSRDFKNRVGAAPSRYRDGEQP